VVTSWFWNAARVPLTSLGVERFGALGPVPAAVVGALVLLMLVGIAVTVTAVTRRDRVDVPAAQEGSPA
jgi:hypothetical protein